MRPLGLDNGALNVAGAKLGAVLQQVSDVPQKTIAPVDRERLGGGENIKLGISQVNGRRHVNFR
jgi:hypothetical protein